MCIFVYFFFLLKQEEGFGCLETITHKIGGLLKEIFFLSPLIENYKLKFGGEVSVRITGASVPSQVLVKKGHFFLLSKIRSFTKKKFF